jgi:hypothetical protein
MKATVRQLVAERRLEVSAAGTRLSARAPHRAACPRAVHQRRLVSEPRALAGSVRQCAVLRRCMNDEASTHYVDIVDQMAIGHEFIKREFGDAARPRIGKSAGRQQSARLTLDAGR